MTAAPGVLDRGHEQVAFFHDRATGLRAIVAIYSTALGPALGGTRFYPYESEAAALDDVLNLSRSMAYKNALAGLDHGGGKAVIIGDPSVDKTDALLRAYGRFVQGLGGRYITACDVGTYVEDMDVVATECDFVTGRSESQGGAGDSSVLTAFGVYQGMLAASEYRWGVDNLAGRRIGIAGIGKVGRHLVGHAVDEGASLVVTDVDPDAVAWVRQRVPGVEVAADADELVSMALDIYAPCALGGALTDSVADRLHAEIVCGAANNQLVHDRIDDRLQAGHPLLPGLPRQCRRRDPGRRRTPRLLVRAGQGQGDHHPSGHARCAAHRGGRGHHARARPPIGWPNDGWTPSPPPTGSGRHDAEHAPPGSAPPSAPFERRRRQRRQRRSRMTTGICRSVLAS